MAWLWKTIWEVSSNYIDNNWSSNFDKDISIEEIEEKMNIQEEEIKRIHREEINSWDYHVRWGNHRVREDYYNRELEREIDECENYNIDVSGWSSVSNWNINWDEWCNVQN